MSTPSTQHDDSPVDPVESIVGAIPIVIPAAGALLIFLLAFIAIYVG
ncbi:MAG: hypothetical protein ACO24Y_05935 [Hylemonella sp.]